MTQRICKVYINSGIVNDFLFMIHYIHEHNGKIFHRYPVLYSPLFAFRRHNHKHHNQTSQIWFKALIG